MLSPSPWRMIGDSTPYGIRSADGLYIASVGSRADAIAMTETPNLTRALELLLMEEGTPAAKNLRKANAIAVLAKAKGGSHANND